jgi:hypothetical protein
MMQAAAVRSFPHVPAGTGETYNVIGDLLTRKVRGETVDTTIRTDRRRLATQGGAALAGLALSGALARMAGAQEATPDAATPVTAADSATAEQNLALFDRLDFEAWNNRDWDLFRQIHGDDVHVEGFGQVTDGIDDHLAFAQAFIAQFPEAKVVAHPIRIGAGDWTAVTGLLNDGSTMATIARWENGRIAEEYLFSLMGGGETESGTPTA